MAILQKVVFYFHLLGLSMVLGGLLTQLKADEKKIFPGMIHGLMAMGVTGLILAGLKGADISSLKIGIKIVLFAAIFGIMNKQRSQPLLPGQFNLLLGLTLLTMAVAVLW